MTDTPARLLKLLSLLQTPREWPGSELAQRLEVSPRTVRRDIERLRELGYPVEASMGAVGGYRLVAGAAMPPLLLDDDEAVAMAVGIRTAAGLAVEGLGEASARALAKLEQVLPSRLRYRVTTINAATMPVLGDGPTVDPEVLTALAAAVANREKVRFGYEANDSTESRRLVEPIGLVANRRRWYLVGHDDDREDWRTFRVDRISRPEAIGVRNTPHELPAEDAADYVAGKRSDWGTPTLHVVATFQAPVHDVAGRLGDTPGDVQPLDERTCRLDSFRDDSMEWLAGRMIVLGCEFSVEQPPELIEHLRALGARARDASARRTADDSPSE
ncbi:helix-turn-helix transcriptional regulator [Phytoactinopolyspora endophytica]|uniref:helix-turn-helix transcriptional regulator n=1 Tax=Phytoactinopolyspora endophytica TaxID=1642495 RepID=UPI00101D1946|nr:YafY family protein [Phytoactinopolyspora endophytica]